MPTTKAKFKQPLVSQAGARAIRELYAAEEGGLTPQDIADRLDCGIQTIVNLLSGKTYKRAGGPLATNLSSRGNPPRFDDDELKRLFLVNPDVVGEEYDDEPDDEDHLVGGEDE